MAMVHTREQFTSQELAIVLSHYDLGIVHGAAEFPRGSHASAKIVVTTDRGKYLVKRRPRGKDDPFRVAFAHALQNYLAGKNFPLPHLIGTKEQNNSMLKLGDAIYEVFEYVDGGPYDASPGATMEAGKTLALYHRLVRDYHPEWQPPRGQYHDSNSVREAFQKMATLLARRDVNAGKEPVVMATVDAIAEAYDNAAAGVNELGFKQWETQIVHSDWHPGNMIFDKGNVVAVIDYDAARIRPRVTDIANGCLQFSMLTGGRNLETWPEQTDTARSCKFLQGYDDLNVISEAEITAIPFLMQEALIAQAVPPILKTATFAGLEGFAFLCVMLKKINWLNDHREEITLSADGS